MKFRAFSINAGTYPYSMRVVISRDHRRVTKYMRKHFGNPAWERGRWPTSCVFLVDGYDPVLWMPAPPRKPCEFGILAHEIFHLVATLFQMVGMPLTESSEEAYAYMTTYLTTQIFTKLKLCA